MTVTRRRAAWLLLSTTLMAGLGGCETAQEPSSSEAGDSAGIQIVESSIPLWSETEGWSLGEVPSTVIGVVEGAEEYQFTRIVSAFRLADGRVIIVDGPSKSVRAFDEDGQFVQAFGGSGDGPGEFGYPSEAFPYRGDSIAVWDATNRQLSIFDADGSTGRRIRVNTRVGTPQGPGGRLSFGSGGSVVGSFPDGTLIVEPDLGLQAESGMIVAYDDEPKRYTADGELLNDLGRYPTGATFIPDIDAFAIGRPHALPVPYARRLAMAVGGSRLFVGADPHNQIRVLTAAGELVQLIRVNHRDLALGQPEIDAYRDEQRRRLQEGRLSRADLITPAGLEAALDELSFPATVPPFSDVLVDSEGFVWTLHYALPEATGPQVWSVFNPEGRLLGEVETPGDVVVEQIGEDYVLGIVTDDLDVPTVHVYSLRRAE